MERLYGSSSRMGGRCRDWGKLISVKPGLKKKAYANAKVCLDAAASALIVINMRRTKTMTVNAVVASGVRIAFWKT